MLCHSTECFNENHTELNSDTKEILHLQDLTTNCINEKEGNDPSCNSSSIVCVDCVHYYQLLNDFYDSHKSYNGFCMDIVDMVRSCFLFFTIIQTSLLRSILQFQNKWLQMNATRYNWSASLCCCTDRRKPEFIYLCLYSSVFLIPVIFYLAIWGYSRSAFQEMNYGE